VVADYLGNRYPRVAVIGAGSKGEFREEDQMCCAWIATALMKRGYTPHNPQTFSVAARWYAVPPQGCLTSKSVAFLKRTGRLNDLDFILGHIDDVPSVFAVQDGEVKIVATKSVAGLRAVS
jgi:2-phosphosulfolactate phosphatase